MNLLPVQYKHNVVSKSRLPAPPSILLAKEGLWLRSGALRRSKPVLTPPCGLEAFLCNDGTWVRLQVLSPSLLREIPSLAAPKRNINPSVSYSYLGRRHVVMGPACAALVRSKVWVP